MDDKKIEEFFSGIDVGNVFDFNINDKKIVVMDFTAENDDLKKIDLDSKEFADYVFQKLDGDSVGVGLYDENRTIYARSKLFSGDLRTYHLGIDLWVRENTGVFGVLDGRVHSFNDNACFGDYGPIIILEHEIDGMKFFTLYGHLTRDSLDGLEKGMPVRKGQKFAEVGSWDVNGNWPPHLHFQIILDMLGREGDFAGVASEKERGKYLGLCPDPNLLLKIDLS